MCVGAYTDIYIGALRIVSLRRGFVPENMYNLYNLRLTLKTALWNSRKNLPVDIQLRYRENWNYVKKYMYS